MKNKFFIVVMLVFSMSLLLVACGGGKSITITNNGTVNYCELYVSASGADAYGGNQLPAGQTVTPGNTFQIPVTESGAYDVRVVACDEAGEQVLTVNVP